MINSFHFLKQFDEQVKSGNLTDLQRKVLLSKYIDILLAKLQIGDSIEGVITKLAEHKYALQIKPNVNIPIQLLEQVETGKSMTFIVQGKEEGKLYLQPAISAEGKETTLVQKTVETFNLPKTASMHEIIEDFLQKHLSLTKDSLTKAHQMNKMYDIPSKVIANLIEHQEIFSMDEAKILSDLRSNGINRIIDDMKFALQKLNDKEDLLSVINLLKENLSSDKLSSIIEKVQREYAKELSENDSLGPVLKTGNKVSGEDDRLLVADHNQIHHSVQNKREVLTVEGSQMFEKLNTGLLKKAAVLIYDEIVHVNLKNIKNDQGETDKIYQTYQLLNKLSKALEQTHLSQEDQDHISYIKEPLNLLSKLNIQAEYFAFPMMYEDKRLQGELYFFKPKKHTQKNKDNIYIVLSLDLPHIHTIEIHINKQEKNIHLHINVNDELIRNHIAQHIPLLNDEVQTLGLEISQLTWGMAEEIDKIKILSEDFKDPFLNHMDFKI